MAVEVWFRNPQRFAPLMVEAGAFNVVWHRGILIKRRTDPVAHANLVFPKGVPWRVMSIGDQGGVEWDWTSRSERHPVACYPVWRYGDPWEDLELLANDNIADNPLARRDPLVEPVYRPHKGQEHRIIISNWPTTNTLAGRQLLASIGELQAEYPKVKFHLFEPRTYRTAFGYGFSSVDLDPATDARFGHVYLPSGRRAARDEYPAHEKWIYLLGFNLSHLKTYEGRVRYNIAAALWASKYYQSAVKFKVGQFVSWEDAMALEDIVLAETPHTKSQSRRAQPGDKIVCDNCSLANYCKVYRAGSVCTLSDSETAGLATFFKTRDADRIIDGLSEILQRQATRAEMGMRNENMTGELDNETSRVLRDLADGGVKLAKLVNPALNGGPRFALQINNRVGGAEIATARPSAIMGAIVRELEAKGVPREDITPEMVMGLVADTEGELTGNFIEVTAHEEEAS